MVGGKGRVIEGGGREWEGVGREGGKGLFGRGLLEVREGGVGEVVGRGGEGRGQEREEVWREG